MAYSLHGVFRLPQELLTLLLQDHSLLVQARAPVLNHQGFHPHYQIGPHSHPLLQMLAMVVVTTETTTMIPNRIHICLALERL